MNGGGWFSEQISSARRLNVCETVYIHEHTVKSQWKTSPQNTERKKAYHILHQIALTPALSTSSSHLFNKSLSTGTLPSNFKSAYITPRLKKPDLYTAEAKSYRPISNLTVLSKLLERLVAKQLLLHLDKHKLLQDLQSFHWDSGAEGIVWHSDSHRQGRPCDVSNVGLIGFIFQQDGAPAHTAHATQDWLHATAMTIAKHEWPPNSPSAWLSCVGCHDGRLPQAGQ